MTKILATESRLLLRMEGVNLANFVLDATQLSVVRGGSLLLLEAVDEVARALEPEGLRVTVVSVGASVGLFEVVGPTESDPAALVDRHLRRHAALRHATFVVDAVPLRAAPLTAEAYDALRAQLVTRNRRRQLSSPTVAFPAFDKDARLPCTVDHTRPGVKLDRVSAESTMVSASVQVRHGRGKAAKQGEYGRTPGTAPEDGDAPGGGLFQRVLRVLDTPSASERDAGGSSDVPSPAAFAAGLRFNNSFEELVASPPPGVSSRLREKMAVLYVDGNGFGKALARALSQGGSDDLLHRHREIDRALRVRRARFLESLLRRTEYDAAWRHGSAIRMEVLLWGGDEIILVVPAWKGWEALRHFFASMQELRLVPDGDVLTHAAGLVFCHRKAPIHRVCELARRLADGVKSVTRDHDAFAYECLESFDHIGDGLTRLRRGRVGLDRPEYDREGEPPDRGSDHECEEAAGDPLLLYASHLTPLTNALEQVGVEVPRSRLHAALRGVACGFSDDRKEAAPRTAEGAWTDVCSSLPSEFGEALEAVLDATRVSNVPAPHAAALYHLAQLREYLSVTASRPPADAGVTS